MRVHLILAILSVSGLAGQKHKTFLGVWLDLKNKVYGIIYRHTCYELFPKDSLKTEPRVSTRLLCSSLGCFYIFHLIH